jgi:molybdopterin-guanine dinucleotide biosynthesis protein A
MTGATRGATAAAAAPVPTLAPNETTQTPPSQAIHGIVLAGGRSSRMGTDKARLAVDGVPLLRRIVETIAPLCRGVTVVVPASDPQRYTDLLGPDTALAADRYDDKGPLAGIHAGLLAMPDECGCGFVIACDMPLFSLQLFRRMEAELNGHSPAPEAVLCPGQPLHALYRRTAAQTAKRLLDAGRLPLLALADSLHTAYVEPLEAACFLNLNTPEEWRAYVRNRDGSVRETF